MKLRRDICLGTLDDLPEWSAGYRPTLAEQLDLVKSAGYQAVVAWDRWAEIQAAGLIAVGMARVLEPAQAMTIARSHADAGLDFTTLHVGRGFESDSEMDRLADAVLEASARTGHALHIETHRATMTQDIYRTINLAKRHSELAFTLDFSHWYTGHEMTYGGEFEDRLAELAPVFAQVRSLQLRIGDTGRIQRPVDLQADYMRDQMAALSACLDAIGQSPNPPEVLSIAPELLAATMGTGRDARPICYAEADEQSDRFADAIILSDLAEHHGS